MKLWTGNGEGEGYPRYFVNSRQIPRVGCNFILYIFQGWQQSSSHRGILILITFLEGG